MAKLLPCPFCGGEAAVRDIEKPSVNGWIPVTERRPKIGEAVLVARLSAIQKVPYVDISRFEGTHWRDGTTAPKVLLSQVTHWMPLPKAPEEGAEK